MSYNIAIDGPAGAGKSTIAKLVAKKLGFIYVDTGALYRAVALYFHDNKLDYTNSKIVNKHIKDINIEIHHDNEGQQVVLNEEVVTLRLRAEIIGKYASILSAQKEVRELLLDTQRNIAKNNNVVMDGRDIGTTVLKDAFLKAYLTASVEVRADRRYKELKENNVIADLEIIKREIIERDVRDMEREISPLVQAKDAILIDSSHLTIEEVVNKIVNLAREKMN